MSNAKCNELLNTKCNKQLTQNANCIHVECSVYVTILHYNRTKK